MIEINIKLGTDIKTGRDVTLSSKKLTHHMHLIGGTGKGKTTAIHTILHALLKHPLHDAAFFIVDRMGNLSEELLLWMASPFCPPHVKERLVYIEPAREDIVCPLHPLSWTSPANAYYRVKRATELILRSWRSQDIQVMARLARWLYYSLMSAAELGLALSDSYHFLEPNESEYHDILIERLSPRLKSKWEEIHTGPKGKVMDILDSTRNRMQPFFASPVLRRMFGATNAILDIHRLRREGKIVLLNLNPYDVLDLQLADTIGSVFLNELFRSAQSHLDEPYPTYVFLDEFQNFVSPDLGDMLPAVRQMGLRLILSHQSFSQLKRGETDLSSIIFQAQTRLCFGLQGPDDADLMAHELGSLTFDDMGIKHIQHVWRQLLEGFDKEILRGGADMHGRGTQQNETNVDTMSQQQSNTYPLDMFGRSVPSIGAGQAHAHGRGSGSSEHEGHTASWHETLVPKYNTYQEPRITFRSFQEWRQIWAREIRRLGTGQAMLQIDGDPEVHHLQILFDKPGYLKYDIGVLNTRFKPLIEAKQQLIEKNFESSLFLPAHEIDRQTERRIRTLVDRSSNPPQHLDSSAPFPD